LATNKQTIERLSERISGLAVAVGAKSELVVIAVPAQLDEAAVIARHCEMFPRDRKAKLTVVVTRFGDADPNVAPFPFESEKISAAWRAVAAEVNPLTFWAVPDGTVPQ
jgi:hypothetical protein